MPYPNSHLSPWVLVLLALVVAVSMATWLILVFRAAREPRPRSTPARDLPALTTLPTQSADAGQPEHDEVAAA